MVWPRSPGVNQTAVVIALLVSLGCLACLVVVIDDLIPILSLAGAVFGLFVLFGK